MPGKLKCLLFRGHDRWDLGVDRVNRRIRQVAWCLGSLGIILILILLILLGFLRHVPDFYRQALAVPAEQQRQLGAELEQQFKRLQETTVRQRRFQAIVSEAQINGWLATTMIARHAHRLPPGVRDVRVSLEEGRARIGATYRKGRIETVVWLIADLRLTEETNVLELHLRGLRAGRLPFSIEKLKDQVASALQRANVSVEWIQDAEDLAAEILLPRHLKELPRQTVRFEKIEIHDGELLLSGAADP